MRVLQDARKADEDARAAAPRSPKPTAGVRRRNAPPEEARLQAEEEASRRAEEEETRRHAEAEAKQSRS